MWRRQSTAFEILAPAKFECSAPSTYLITDATLPCKIWNIENVCEHKLTI